jgi:hypothetical protein
MTVPSPLVIRLVPVVGCLVLAPPSGAETHRFKPTTGHPTFAVREPVLTVAPGDVLESETLWGEWYEKPSRRSRSFASRTWSTRSTPSSPSSPGGTCRGARRRGPRHEEDAPLTGSGLRV